jgi:fatty acid desaturase
MTTLIALSLFVLTVARLTRLVNADAILDPIRIAIARKRGADSTLVYFLGCVWCVGLWLSLLLAIPTVAYLGWEWWTLFPLGLSASHVVGLLARLDDAEEIDIETVEVS